MVPMIANSKDHLNLLRCFVAFSVCGETQIFEIQQPIKSSCRVARIGDQKTAGHHIAHNSHYTNSLGPAPCSRIPEIGRRVEETNTHTHS